MRCAKGQRKVIDELKLNRKIGEEVTRLDADNSVVIVITASSAYIKGSGGATTQYDLSDRTSFSCEYNKAQLAENRADLTVGLAHELGHIYAAAYMGPSLRLGDLMSVYFEMAVSTRRGWVHDAPKQ